MCLWGMFQVFIKNMLFLPKTRRNDNRENNQRGQYSKDLGQGGMELPAKYIFRSTDEDMNSKLPTLIGKAMQEYQKAVKEEKEEQAKKEKQTKKKNRQKKSDTRKQFVKIVRKNILKKTFNEGKMVKLSLI